MNTLSGRRLYGILDTGYVPAERMIPMTSSLLAGGVQILQLRAKKETPLAILAMAREITPLCRAAGVPFLINDHPELVPEAGADGAHIGQEDMTVAEARRLAGPGSLIGKSTHSTEQVLASVGECPDYIGFGPLFATPTKPDYKPVGTDLIRTVLGSVPYPVYCIGGISAGNLTHVLAAGARNVVLVSDLLKAKDPKAHAALCRSLLAS
jgi:thiamine-phosphate pyrophosphorylase